MAMEVAVFAGVGQLELLGEELNVEVRYSCIDLELPGRVHHRKFHVKTIYDKHAWHVVLPGEGDEALDKNIMRAIKFGDFELMHNDNNNTVEMFMKNLPANHPCRGFWLAPR